MLGVVSMDAMFPLQGLADVTVRARQLFNICCLSLPGTVIDSGARLCFLHLPVGSDEGPGYLQGGTDARRQLGSEWMKL